MPRQYFEHCNVEQKDDVSKSRARAPRDRAATMCRPCRVAPCCCSSCTIARLPELTADWIGSSLVHQTTGLRSRRKRLVCVAVCVCGVRVRCACAVCVCVLRCACACCGVCGVRRVRCASCAGYRVLGMVTATVEEQLDGFEAPTAGRFSDGPVAGWHRDAEKQLEHVHVALSSRTLHCLWSVAWNQWPIQTGTKRTRAPTHTQTKTRRDPVVLRCVRTGGG